MTAVCPGCGVWLEIRHDWRVGRIVTERATGRGHRCKAGPCP